MILGRTRHICIYRAIKDFSSCHVEYSVKELCKLGKVTRGAYYKWLHRKPGANDDLNRKLASLAEDIHEKHPDRGYRRIRDKIAHDDGLHVNDKRILRICRKKKLCSVVKGRHNGCTRPSVAPYYTAENILNRDFHADRCNQKNYNLDQAPYAIVDQSHSALSQDLIAHIDGSPAFERVVTLTNPSQIADYIDSGEAIVAIVIPQDFDDILSRGGSAAVQIILDGKNSSIAGIASGYVSRIIAQWNLDHHGGKQGLTVISRTWYNPNQITQWNFIPSLMAMISFAQVMLLGGMSIAKEREQGTFDQLLVTPLSPGEILIGKALPPMLVGLFQSGVILLLALFWFEIPLEGSLAALFLSLIVFMLSSTGIGLSISSIADNMQQVLIYVLVSMVPMVLLSGLATPIRNMPEFLQILTYADPMRFAIDAVRRIYMEGAGLYDVRWDFIPMLLITTVTMPMAAWLFRHKTT